MFVFVPTYKPIISGCARNNSVMYAKGNSGQRLKRGNFGHAVTHHFIVLKTPKFFFIYRVTGIPPRYTTTVQCLHVKNQIGLIMISALTSHDQTYHGKYILFALRAHIEHTSHYQETNT